MLSVFLTGTEIQAVSGSVLGRKYRVDRVWRQELSPEAFQNGAITDAALLTGAVAAFWRANRLPKRANLVIGNAHFVRRNVDAPRLRGRRLRAFLSRAYAEPEHMSRPVFTCFPLSTDARKRLTRYLVAAGEQTALREITDVFRAAGVKLTAADSALGCSVRVLRSLNEVRGKTAVVQFFEGGSLNSLLFVRGEYAYSAANRMTDAPDSLAFGVGAARIVSSILQFCEAQYPDEAVTEVLFAGLSPESAAVCAESITQMDPALEVSVLRGGAAVSGRAAASFPERIAAVGGLNMPQELELLKELRRKPERGGRDRKSGKLLLPTVLALAVLGAASGILLNRNARLERQLAELRGFIENPRYSAAGAEYEEAEAALRALEGRTEALESAVRRIESYPLPTGEVADALLRCAEGLAETEITGYDADTGVLSVRSSAADAASVHEFIGLLRQEDTFADVRYSGYRYRADAERWSVEVVCTLAADAGRREEAEPCSP